MGAEMTVGGGVHIVEEGRQVEEGTLLPREEKTETHRLLRAKPDADSLQPGALS